MSKITEPDIYAPGSRYSFFGDLAQSALDGRADSPAAERLRRHQEFENRAGGTTTLGAGGEFSPPGWLIDHFKTASRAGRPFGDLLNPVPLPAGVQSINIPKLAVPSASTGVQAGQSEAVFQVDDTTADLSSPVVTISGQVDVSQQLYDLTPNPGLDAVGAKDLTLDYNVALEKQLLTGSGINGQLTGLSNFSLPTPNTVSGSGATTMTTLWPLLGQAAAAVSNQRLMPPEVWLMAPRRWFWMASSLDSSNRPIASPGSVGIHVDSSVTPAGGTRPFGPVLGLPVYLDGTITAGTAADQVWCLRPSDMFLFEGAPRYSASVNATAGTLQVRLQLHRYVAFIGNTYTSAIATVTAIPQPSNF